MLAPRNSVILLVEGLRVSSAYLISLAWDFVFQNEIEGPLVEQMGPIAPTAFELSLGLTCLFPEGLDWDVETRAFLDNPS